MKFTRIVFGIAATYGFITVLPLYFLRDKIGREAPPPISHPEFYYGFVGVTLGWQLIYVLMAVNPLRYRAIIPIAVLEKFVYTVPVLILNAVGEVHPNILRPSFVDPIFGFLFVMAYFRTRKLTSDDDIHRGVVKL